MDLEIDLHTLLEVRNVQLRFNREAAERSLQARIIPVHVLRQLNINVDSALDSDDSFEALLNQFKNLVLNKDTVEKPEGRREELARDKESFNQEALQAYLERMRDLGHDEY